jgi:hypothetical protein
MSDSSLLPCDGCGQLATSEHVAKRLARLEGTTRYRPVHIATVLLGAAVPASDADFLYSLSGGFSGQAGRVLRAAGISQKGKSAEAILVEFQRRGLLLTHVLECPIESGNNADLGSLLRARFPATAARIRRSFRPKRVVPVSRYLESLLQGPSVPVDLGCPVVLDNGKPFSLDDDAGDTAISGLRQELKGAEGVGCA